MKAKDVAALLLKHPEAQVFIPTTLSVPWMGNKMTMFVPFFAVFWHKSEAKSEFYDGADGVFHIVDTEEAAGVEKTSPDWTKLGTDQHVNFLDAMFKDLEAAGMDISEWDDPKPTS